MSREGLVLWPNVRGVNGSNGRIELTKNIDHKKTPHFICEIIQLLSFPCWISIDAFGFITDTEHKVLGFQFASKNSGIQLKNQRSKLLLDSKESRKALYQTFSEMSSDEFLLSWFESHDRISQLVRSGFIPKRTCTLILYLEPVSTSVKEIFRLK